MKKYKPEIQKMLVLSTAHITLADSKILEAKGFMYCDGVQFGWHIAGLSSKAEERRTFIAEACTAGLSIAFMHACLLAIKTGCKRLLLDADGPIDPSLATFVW